MAIFYAQLSLFYWNYYYYGSVNSLQLHWWWEHSGAVPVSKYISLVRWLAEGVQYLWTAAGGMRIVQLDTSSDWCIRRVGLLGNF